VSGEDLGDNVLTQGEICGVRAFRVGAMGLLPAVAGEQLQTGSYDGRRGVSRPGGGRKSSCASMGVVLSSCIRTRNRRFPSGDASMAIGSSRLTSTRTGVDEPCGKEQKVEVFAPGRLLNPDALRSWQEVLDDHVSADPGGDRVRLTDAAALQDAIRSHPATGTRIHPAPASSGSIWMECCRTSSFRHS
jgi:hypothetical protein